MYTPLEMELKVDFTEKAPLAVHLHETIGPSSSWAIETSTMGITLAIKAQKGILV